MALLGAMPVIASTAGALPPVCQPQIAAGAAAGIEAANRPCQEPPDDPPTTTTPPTTTPPPPRPDWTTNVSMLAQDGAWFSPLVYGSWGRSDVFSPSFGQVNWTNPAQNEGTLTLAGKDLPVGGTIGFGLFEIGSAGRLCRSTPRGDVSPSGGSVHVLVTSPMTSSPADLNAMAAGFTGRVQPDPDEDTQVTITDATLDPQAGGLLLTLHGTIWRDIQFPLPNFDGTFTYTVLLHMAPSTSIDDLHSVMNVWADTGTLDVSGDGITDDIELWFGDNMEPKFRTAVVDKTTSAVNDRVANDPQVTWFASLGYSVSVRSVDISTSGLTVQPSLCKVA